MDADDSITFSESISQQTTGVVFVFSEYYTDSGTYRDQGFWTRFIPKYVVSQKSGKFFQFSEPLWSASGGIMVKGMWLSDTGASGHASSVYSTSPYKSGACCLRYVIGV